MLSSSVEKSTLNFGNVQQEWAVFIKEFLEMYKLNLACFLLFIQLSIIEHLEDSYKACG